MGRARTSGVGTAPARAHTRAPATAGAHRPSRNLRGARSATYVGHARPETMRFVEGVEQSVFITAVPPGFSVENVCQRPLALCRGALREHGDRITIPAKLYFLSSRCIHERDVLWSDHLAGIIERDGTPEHRGAQAYALLLSSRNSKTGDGAYFDLDPHRAGRADRLRRQPTELKRRSRC